MGFYNLSPHPQTTHGIYTGLAYNNALYSLFSALEKLLRSHVHQLSSNLECDMSIKMGKIYTSLTTLFVAFVVIKFAIADSQVNGIGLDQKSVGVIANNNSSVDEKVETVKKTEDEKGGLGVGVENLKSGTNEKSSKQLESKEAAKERKEAKGDEFLKEGEKKDGAMAVADSKNEKGTVNLPPVRKESSRGEECDSSSISCSDDKKALVACLRVPGNESPDLSLLIQNKGKGTLKIKISAPNFVKLEKEQIQVQEKEDKKVRVSIRGAGADNFIILAAGNGNCSLDFKDLITQSSNEEVNYASHLKYISLSKHSSSLGLILLAALLLVASPWICIKFRKRQTAENGHKYEKLDMGLPVSTGSKTESGLNDGWDESWGDSWDDEEAPKTPTMPVTPSLSSKGIASRRPSKEGWKD